MLSYFLSRLLFISTWPLARLSRDECGSQQYLVCRELDMAAACVQREVNETCGSFLALKRTSS